MVKYSLFIEDDEAGAVIGKGGEKIREIRQLTGVSLTVKKSAKSGSASRLLQIEGPERNVEMAKHLVNIRLKLHHTALEENEC